MVTARPAVSAIPPRPAIAAVAATAVTATVATIAARSAVAAFAGFARRAGVGQLFTGLLVDEAHRQAHLAALVDLEQLDLDLLAFAEDVADVLDTLVLDLRDVHQAVLAGHESHERAEVDDARHLAGVDGAGLRLRDDAADPLACGLDLVEVGRADLDDAFVVDVDLGAGRRDDLADDLAAGADDFADLVLGDRHRLDARRVGRQLLARMIERLGHFAEDVRTTVLGLCQGDLHHFLGDASDLDVHLQGRDAFTGPGNLEVHV